MNRTLKPITLLCLAVIAAALPGCQQDPASANPTMQPMHADTLDRQLVDATFACMERNAIIAQHTLYPYHFAADSAELTKLGQRDLDVLIDHFMNNSGQLNINRGQAGVDLYNRRVRIVTDALTAAGIDSSRVQIGDGLPGGDGISSTDAFKAWERRGLPVKDKSARDSVLIAPREAQ